MHRSEPSRSQPARRTLLDRLRAAVRRYKSRPEPDEPYALVGAPKRPRTPLRGAAAVEPDYR